jgi:glutamine amidotransferase
MKIAVIDYGMCNLDSVARAVEKCGGKPIVTDETAVIQNCDAIILPGVGAFKDAMTELASRGIVALLRDLVLKEDVPFLGICLGMHLMATEGSEGGVTPGLDLINGKVIRLNPKTKSIKVPHVGWNDVEYTKASAIFESIENNTDFYFVHSYHFVCNEAFVIGRTTHGERFISAINQRNCFGVQFHPEKSLKNGLRLIKNFIALC